MACSALIGIMSPFASCGTGHVMIKYVARDRNVLAAYLGNALLVTAAFGLGSDDVRARFSGPCASGVIHSRNADCSGDLRSLRDGNDQHLPAGVSGSGARPALLTLMAFSTGVRLVAAIMLLAVGPTAVHWAYLYAASAVIATTAGIVAVSRCCAPPRFQLNLFFPSVREGFHLPPRWHLSPSTTILIRRCWRV